MPRIRCIRAAPTARRRPRSTRARWPIVLRAKAIRAQALKAYEAARAAPAAKVVRTNREHPPDFINIKVEELVGDKPFDNLDKYISQDELRALSDNYKRIAGFALADVAPGRS